MTVKKLKQNPDEIFIEEFFGLSNKTLKKKISSILDLYQDKWSIRLILLAYYFLGDKANEMNI